MRFPAILFVVCISSADYIYYITASYCMSLCISSVRLSVLVCMHDIFVCTYVCLSLTVYGSVGFVCQRSSIIISTSLCREIAASEWKYGNKVVFRAIGVS